MGLHLIGRKFIGFEKALARQAKAFARAGGPEVTFEFLEVEELYQRMVARKGCLEPGCDLMMVVTDWYPTLIAQKALLPLDASIAAGAPPDWPGGWTPSMLALQRGPAARPGRKSAPLYGLPYHDGPEMFIYRKDLFDSGREKQKFLKKFGRPLEPPRNWCQFLEVAQFFTRPEKDLFGTIFASFPDAHNIIYDFFLHLWTRGGKVFDRRGRPAFHQRPGIEALTYVHDLIHRHRVTPPDCSEIDSVKSGERFAAGQVAMMVNWMGFAAFADAHESSRVRGRVGCDLIPAGEGPKGFHCSLNIYWCLSIPAGSVQPQAAYQFLQWCARPEMDIITSEEGAIGVRKSTWSAFARKGVAGYAELERLHQHARHLPQLSSFGPLSEILNEHLDHALNRGGNIQEQLEKAADRCARIQ